MEQQTKGSCTQTKAINSGLAAWATSTSRHTASLPGRDRDSSATRYQRDLMASSPRIAHRALTHCCLKGQAAISYRCRAFWDVFMRTVIHSNPGNYSTYWSTGSLIFLSGTTFLDGGLSGYVLPTSCIAQSETAFAREIKMSLLIQMHTYSLPATQKVIKINKNVI